MLPGNEQLERYSQLDYRQQCLPQMTALFVDGLSGKSKSSKYSSYLEPGQWFDSKIRRFRVPIKKNERITLDEVKSFCTRIEEPNCRSRRKKTNGDEVAMRQFICGISNCFNNILMGIWGNISLMSISTDENHPVMDHVRNMDRLIHNGSLLIHSLFGYLAERRVATRHLRLVQLVQEINQSINKSDMPIDILELEKSMERVYQKTRPKAVAGDMARILNQLLHWIDNELQSALSGSPKDIAVLKRLKTMDRLIKKGFDFIRQLRFFCGDSAPNWQEVNIKSLVLEQVKQFRNNFKDLEINVNVSDTLNPINADRDHLKFILEQLMKNAATAMKYCGQVLICARPINEEVPEERCVVNPACSYTVITVSDNGVGMSKRVQSKIFLPFFASNPKSNPVGLGLAASSSIAKIHGGYLQVKSSKGQGSTFKIYLPDARPQVFHAAL